MNFVHIPKTGGSSIQAALAVEKQGGVIRLQTRHDHASEVQRPRFSFVRHPLDRLVSAWEFWRGQGKLGEMNEQALRDQLLVQERINGSITPYVTLRPQVEWLDGEMDFIGHFESLAEDFAKISPAKLPHLNGSDRKLWQEYFTPAMLDMAGNYYRKDFEVFGYG